MPDLSELIYWFRMGYNSQMMIIVVISDSFLELPLQDGVRKIMKF